MLRLRRPYLLLILASAHLLIAAEPVRAAVPLNPIPAWISDANGHVATGGAWADVDEDGWLDMIVANGNDIEQQGVIIYHNNGDGTLPQDPTWSSAGIAYHGHIDVGDINGDGHVDVAVAVYIGVNGFSTPGTAKVYLNNGLGEFSPYADWIPAESFYCFSLALGDADGDGDLDLACACGDDYYDHNEHQRIFYNNDGILETSPSWVSDEIDYALDVTWDDVDLDGDMDVLFCGTSSPMRIYLNNQTTGGGIETTASWENTDMPQDGNTTAFGDWDNDGYPEIAVADNDQLGGPGFFKVYQNSAGVPGPTPAWHSATSGYGSHVSWIDLDLDGDLDLAAGRWWGAGVIYENTGGMLTSVPVWETMESCVVENMFWGDVNNDGLRTNGHSMLYGTGVRTFFKLGHAPVRSIDQVLINGSPVTHYTFHAGNGWISMASPPPDGALVEILYTYSRNLDLAITNWESGAGNFLYLNTGASSAPDITSALSTIRIAPNPMQSWTQIRYNGAGADEARLEVFNVAGQRVKTIHQGPLSGGLLTWEWHGDNDTGRRLPSGLYFMRMTASGHSRTAKILVME
ncbi:MAG: VCBS repeat-containing protein [Candidatus Eisenbacteria bacterium]|uniref:VCBS repeat-containing protein n=1 Tax=Eiseniibacteriota bacterium TaxID=2212470 RepID=A0A948WEL5_UNCEI|nr:VCBS repeat-containing protein [Candidatus Eisenbacteria bacterium]MBU1948788.1 VCBS repeat-containing protein [Candidatus Eisenbacteria bacterium]MBU2692873.1 VCBS repeat-containing protein [Candidatus Eisenbacteria bacterium]